MFNFQVHSTIDILIIEVAGIIVVGGKLSKI